MKKLSILTVAAAAFASTSASAMDPITIVGGVPTIHVSYADLNLATAAGRDRLDQRVRQAANQLCVDNAVRDIDRALAGRTCVSDAISSADAQVRMAGKSGLGARQLIAVALKR